MAKGSQRSQERFPKVPTIIMVGHDGRTFSGDLSGDLWEPFREPVWVPSGLISLIISKLLNNRFKGSPGILMDHFGLITFRLAYGGTHKSWFLWFRDFWACSWAPKPILFIFADARTLQIIQEKTKNVFRKKCCWQSEIWTCRVVWKCVTHNQYDLSTETPGHFK